MEHIIPQQIGGKLWARFLCKPCNDRLGSDIEREVKEDPAIRLAVRNLQTQLPDLACRLEEGQRYVGAGPAGSVLGRIGGGTFRVDSGRCPDGSIIQPNSEGRAHIEKALRKQNFEEKQVAEILRRFDEVPVGERLDLAGGLVVIKRPLDTVEPALVGPFCSHRVLLKIAFEFAACHLGARAYDGSEQLTAIRAAVFNSSVGAGVCDLEELRRRQYAPIHRLEMAGLTPHVIITICLFGYLVYRVHLYQIALPTPYFAYTCCLDTGEEQWEKVDQEGNAQQP